MSGAEAAEQLVYRGVELRDAFRRRHCDLLALVGGGGHLREAHEAPTSVLRQLHVVAPAHVTRDHLALQMAAFLTCTKSLCSLSVAH